MQFATPCHALTKIIMGSLLLNNLFLQLKVVQSLKYCIFSIKYFQNIHNDSTDMIIPTIYRQQNIKMDQQSELKKTCQSEWFQNYTN